MPTSVFEISRSMDQFLHRFMGAMGIQVADLGLGLSKQDVGMIMIIKSNDGLSIGELVKSMRRDKAQITRNVKQLEAKGILTRKPSEVDKRVSMLFLTPKGRENAMKLDDAMAVVMQEMTAPLSQSELDQFSTLLAKLT